MGQNPFGQFGGLLGQGASLGSIFGLPASQVEQSQRNIDAMRNLLESGREKFPCLIDQPRPHYLMVSRKTYDRLMAGEPVTLQQRNGKWTETPASEVSVDRVERSTFQPNVITFFFSNGIMYSCDIRAAASGVCEPSVIEKIVRVLVRRASWWRLICCRVGLHWILWSQPDRQGLRRGKCACCPHRDVTGPKGCVVDG